MDRFLIAIGLCVGLTSAAFAQEWVASKTDMLPSPEQRYAAPDGLPDGEVTISDVGDIRAAWYDQPTKRYGHGILGDAIEAGRLVVELPDGKRLSYSLPENQVFEDRTPRLATIAGFETIEVVTLLADVDQGASVAVFGVREGGLKLLAQTPFIGRSNRWRNVAGIADFDGDGNIQIAEVVTPHIGGTLRFWTWKNDTLIPSGELFGFSNHAIGSREQELSVIEDFDGDGVTDVALPNADRKALRIMKFSGSANGEKTLEELANIPLPSRIDKHIAVEVEGDAVSIIVGLEDNSVWKIEPKKE